jgi:uncharacterized protein (UPF0335 family)
LTKSQQSKSAVSSLSRSLRGKLSGDSNANAAREHIKDKIAGAVENVNLHRKAFNIVTAAAKMDEMKRNDLKAALDLYWDMASEKGLFGTEHHGDPRWAQQREC